MDRKMFVNDASGDMWKWAVLAHFNTAHCI